MNPSASFQPATDAAFRRGFSDAAAKAKLCAFVDAVFNAPDAGARIRAKRALYHALPSIFAASQDECPAIAAIESGLFRAPAPAEQAAGVTE